MEYFLITFAVLLLALIGIAVAILISLKSMIRNINTELRRLDSKLEMVQFPNVRDLNLEQFAKKLRGIVEGIRSIRPKKD